jgi:hypothetical protein
VSTYSAEHLSDVSRATTLTTTTVSEHAENSFRVLLEKAWRQNATQQPDPAMPGPIYFRGAEATGQVPAF